MPTQPHGISRSRFRSGRPALAHRSDPDAMAGDLRTLDQAIGDMDRQVDQTVNRLTRRINEMILSGSLAERPVAGVADRIYLVVVNHVPGALYFDDGTQWVLVGSPTLDTQRAGLAGGETSYTFTVDQPSATYMPSFSTTWWTMTKVTGQSTTALTVEFSNPPTAGDVLTVVIP